MVNISLNSAPNVPFIKVTETELATVSNYLPTFCREFNFTDLFLGTSKRMRLVKVSFLA